MKTVKTILSPILWFYNEFGLASITETGRNAYLIILARTLRMVAYGTNSLILALFFSELGISDYRIGLFMSLTLLGDVFLGVGLTLIADKIGRRRILFGGSFLMVLSGLIFAIFENYYVLLFSAIIGVISATGGDFGPFRAIEESVLSQLTTPTTRSDVLAWYVTTSTLGSALGSEASGRIVHYLQSRDDWSLRNAYHALFWVYTGMGLVNAVLVVFLTDACELQPEKGDYSELAQNEGPGDAAELDEVPEITPEDVKASKFSNIWTKMTSHLADISAPTRSVMYKLWFLLAIDSIADGMVPYSLTNYYMDERFHPAKSTLGDVTSISYFLGAISAIFAGPLARKIGLINTMVFTHIPSSAAVLFFPLPGVLWMTVILLMIRAGLNNMDQAPRSAFIAAVVKPGERTAVMGITSMLRTLAAMTGPSITGVLAGNNQFWIAFVAAGAFRLAYDVGLYVMFRNMELYKHERAPGGPLEMNQVSREAVMEAYVLEDMPSGSASDDSDEDTTKLYKEPT